MKKKKDVSGLIFSAFLVIAYVVCSYFFIGIIAGSSGLDGNIKLLMKAGVYLLFGAILFYATRVGDGKQIKRFSLSALLLIDLPALYIILAACFTMFPFPFDISNSIEMVSIASVALGYAIPYTFLSGYEIDIPKPEKDTAEKETVSDTENPDSESKNTEDEEKENADTNNEDKADTEAENNSDADTETDTEKDDDN